MTHFVEFARAVHQAALDLVDSFDPQVARECGFSAGNVRQWTKLQRVYAGRTRYRAQQARARQLVEAHNVSIDMLLVIERHIGHIVDQGQQWELRRELLTVRGGCEAVRRRAKSIVPAKEGAAPEVAARFSTSRSGYRSMVLTAPERAMADIEFAARRGLDAQLPESAQMGQNVLRMLFGKDRTSGGVSEGDGSETAVLPAVPRPMILVGLPEYARIVGGDGDDVVLCLTDGTTMTGAQFLRDHVGDQLGVALFDPVEGPVNAYRSRRFANQKQRDLASLVMPVCAAAGCRHGADNCEMHHMEAWKHGGATNAANLVPLCRYHNRVNDDDPGRPGRSGHGGKRGRVERVLGAPMWITPRGYGLVNEGAEWGAMNQLFNVLDRVVQPVREPGWLDGLRGSSGGEPPDGSSSRSSLQVSRQ